MRKLWLRAGFTLVELLVVIAIIGILVSLLLPAVQSAREAALRTQCMNNLKQMSLGNANFETALKSFPSAGWGWNWVGDGTKGVGRMQPGSFFFSLLPYIEEQQVFDADKGLTGDPKSKTSPLGLARLMQLKSYVPAYMCPSRRGAVPPYRDKGFLNAPLPEIAMKGDYALNCGTGPTTGGAQPGSSPLGPASDDKDVVQRYPWPDGAVAEAMNGMAMPYGALRINEVSDGTSKTYLLGEKNIKLNNENELFDDGGDDQCLYTGFTNDNGRNVAVGRPGQPGFTGFPPTRDTIDYYCTDCFGSNHPGGVNMAMCDGSVRLIPYGIDLAVHALLGMRNDEMPVELP